MPAARDLTVLRTERLTENMQRIVLGGEALKGFPQDKEGGYIKLLFPNNTVINDGENSDIKPILRTYTVRKYDAEVNELSLDMVLHQDSAHAGVAATWASNVQTGANISIMGPGPVKQVRADADWFLLAGDMTALPALMCNLEQMPENAKGYAVLEILSEEDKQPLHAPKGIEIIWIINPNPGGRSQKLLDAVCSLPWLQGDPAIWSACEFSTMQGLRQYYREERKVNKRDIYVSSYWKKGRSEDEHKADKRKDALTYTD